MRGKSCLFSRGVPSHAKTEIHAQRGNRSGIPRIASLRQWPIPWLRRWVGRPSALFLCLVAAVASGCKEETPNRLPPLDPSEILTEGRDVESRPFGVDVFLDATSSMEGFAAAPDSTYLRFLEDLEGTLVSEVKNIADVRYFKFGENLREISRSEFRDARNSQFYHEPGIFRDTNIDLILRRRLEARQPTANSPAEPADARVVLAATDLFQKDQDVNILVQQIKVGCLADPGCSVGVLAVPSAFDGMVHDSRGPSFKYRSSADKATFRPFYLLMFGPERRLLQLGEILSAKEYVSLEKFLVAGPRIVKSFAVAISRDPQAEGVSLRKGTGAVNEATFNLRKGHTQAKVRAEVRIELDRRTFGFEPAKIRLRAFRQDDDRLISAEKELVLDSVTGNENELGLSLIMRPPEQKGIYIYLAELELGNINGFKLPAWIAGLSSDNPSPNRDAAKTLNLDRLLERLIAAGLQVDQRPSKLAQFRIQIHRL